MSTTFASLSLCEPVLRALTAEGYETPTPIQAKAIPHVLEGRDVLGCAQTGTGKTAAFAVPILHRLVAAGVKPGPRKPRVLVLSPTRELATQIAESFKTYGKHTGLTGAVIFGGVSQRPQEQNLARGVDIIVATPGRLLDLTDQGCVDYSQIRTLVLDEADRMLDMGFINPIRQIAARVQKDRQTLLFSATMPREIMHLADSLLRNPEKVSVTPVSSAAPLIEQSVYMIDAHAKQALLAAIVSESAVERAVVFTKTKHGADKVCKRLFAAGVSAVAIHGNKNQNQRIRSLDGFRSGRHKVLVATDVAARGLDVDGITHVVNFDLPLEPESYVHRIGRTGRAGATGVAIAFCDPNERGLLRAIERLTGKRIPVNSEMPDLTAFKALIAEPKPQAPTRGQGGHGGQGGFGQGGRGAPRQRPEHRDHDAGRPARPAKPQDRAPRKQDEQPDFGYSPISFIEDGEAPSSPAPRRPFQAGRPSGGPRQGHPAHGHPKQGQTRQGHSGRPGQGAGHQGGGHGGAQQGEGRPRSGGPAKPARGGVFGVNRRSKGDRRF